MANTNQKRIIKENTKTFSQIQNITYIINIIYILYHIIYHWKTFTFFPILGYTMIISVYVLCIGTIKSHMEPIFTEEGSMMVEDLGKVTGTLVEYVFDIIYLQWIIQIGVTVIHRYFWFVYLSVPLYLVYNLGGYALQYILPWFSKFSVNKQSGVVDEDVGKKILKNKKF
jgi:hypothetical protein